jgi:hypothetical protein
MDLPEGFAKQSQVAPDGSPYQGRFTMYDVQVTNDQGSVFITSTVSIQMIIDACNSNMLWTDQSVQRGIKPEAGATVPRYLSLQSGFPDKTKYVFEQSRSEEIADKLLRGEKLFLNPLIWNLRPGDFKAYHDSAAKRLNIYEGRIYLPDSHHRHQGILHAARIYNEAPAEYPGFSLDRQLIVELYFMTPEDEGEYFYEKNQLGKTADKSKAFDLTTQDNLALAARKAIELSPSLIGNVNRVTDRLTAKNRQVMTLSTLVGIIRSAAGSEIANSQVDALAHSFASFYELLSDARPELKLLTEEERLSARKTLMIDQAVILHGFAPTIRRFHAGLVNARASGEEAERAYLDDWKARLGNLADADYQFVDADGTVVWEGDMFDRRNPLWRHIGILQPTKAGGMAVSNTRQTRVNAATHIEERLGVAADE